MIILGDLHLKKEEPFYSAGMNTLNWIKENYADQTIIQLGDIYHTSSPHNSIRTAFGNIVKDLRFYSLGGNHENSITKGSSLEPLSLLGVTVINEVISYEIEGHSCMFLPHNDNMKEYEKLTGEYDFVFTHITPKESIADFGEGISLKLKAKKFIHGHVHLQQDYTDRAGNDNIIVGVPYPTRHLEDNQDHRILQIGSSGEVSEIFVPFQFKYEKVEYDTEPESKGNILNIVNAPDISSAKKRYKGYYIRDEGIEVQRTELEEIKIDMSKDSMKKEFTLFATEKNISEEVFTFGLTLIDELATIE